MSDQYWETARSVQNGGSLSCTEAAAAWKERPADHWYPLSTDESDKWITKSVLNAQRSRSGVVSNGGHIQ